MGSICFNYKKERWHILDEGRLKSSGKPVYVLAVGEYDDYGGGGCLSIIKQMQETMSI